MIAHKDHEDIKFNNNFLVHITYKQDPENKTVAFEEHDNAKYIVINQLNGVKRTQRDLERILNLYKYHASHSLLFDRARCTFYAAAHQISLNDFLINVKFSKIEHNDSMRCPVEFDELRIFMPEDYISIIKNIDQQLYSSIMNDWDFTLLQKFKSGLETKFGCWLYVHDDEDYTMDNYIHISPRETAELLEFAKAFDQKREK